MFLKSTRVCIICCSELIKGYNAGQKITATLLADKFNINIRTLNPSLNKMTRAGILKSQVGGVDRGYIFARNPKDISVYEIIKAVQGYDYMKNCKDATKGSTCTIDECSTCKFYTATSSIVDFGAEKLKNISIYDVFAGDVPVV